jgi:hypothetical protein
MHPDPSNNRRRTAQTEQLVDRVPPDADRCQLIDHDSDGAAQQEDSPHSRISFRSRVPRWQRRSRILIFIDSDCHAKTLRGIALPRVSVRIVAGLSPRSRWYELGGEVDAHFSHRLDNNRVELVGWLTARAAHVEGAAGEMSQT